MRSVPRVDTPVRPVAESHVKSSKSHVDSSSSAASAAAASAALAASTS